MAVEKNNPYDLMGNDPDFLAAAVYADKKRFILNGEETEDKYWPVWTLLYTVEAWHIEGKVLVIERKGEDNDGHGGTGGNPADGENVYHTGRGG